MTPRQRAIGKMAIILGVVAVAIVAAAGVLLAMNQPNHTNSLGLERSGPISTYPASWGVYSSCPSFQTEGNTTTLPLGVISYPNSWNTTTTVTLDQVYERIVDSPAFAGLASGHGWVVYSWSFVQGGSNNPIPNSDDIVGYYILTDGTSPNGYVTAYYDIQNGNVATSSPTTTVTVVCPTTMVPPTTSSASG